MIPNELRILFNRTCLALSFIIFPNFGYGARSVSLSSEPVTHDVQVGAYINDIHNLDLRTHSFHADVYVWMKWKGKNFDPTQTMEIMNPFELWALSKFFTYDKPRVLSSGENYQVVRLQGNFSEKFDLANYPFDPQSLHINFEDSEFDKKGIRYQIEKEAVTINPSIKLPGFVIGIPKLTVREVSYPTSFGDLMNGEANRSAYSQVHLEIPIKRPVLPYSFKLLLPVICVVFCASLMFLINPTYVDSRVGIGITALLTVVALQITLNEDLPEIDYLVLIDKVYLATYFYVIAGLAAVVKTTWIMERADAGIARAIFIDKICLVGLTLVYFVLVLTLILTALLH